MNVEKHTGVPEFTSLEFRGKQHEYVLLIPIINEGTRILKELARAYRHRVYEEVDIVICDGGSTDGCTEAGQLRRLRVNTLLVKQGAGKQGAQLRMGMYWALRRGYKGILTIDGNNKDSIEDVPRFTEKLREGYDFVQGSRFVPGGRAIRTPLVRSIAVKCIHAPMISLTAHHRFTDSTNAYRAYSARYLEDPRVAPFRDIFSGYELLAYLSVRASQLGMRVCEVPVTRAYPRTGKTPTKISGFRGNAELIKILFRNAAGRYDP